jgi:prepilin-type N-terminal cleavage/methylation domain-containing protein
MHNLTPAHLADKQIGFTLVEMAIVLMILALLLGGLLPTLSGQVEQRRISETNKQLDEIKEALIGFAISNGRLPCPANGTIATGQSGAGMEVASCTTSATAGGVLPWATLGVSETDAWGRRFTYRVTPDFADAVGTSTYGGCTPSPTPTQSSFALCSSGNLTVLSKSSGGSNIATNVPAVVVSHGTNGYGAYTTAGSTLPGASGDESENANNDNNFVSHDMTPTFDDLVTWISPNILMNRMVSAGKLP